MEAEREFIPEVKKNIFLEEAKLTPLEAELMKKEGIELTNVKVRREKGREIKEIFGKRKGESPYLFKWIEKNDIRKKIFEWTSFKEKDIYNQKTLQGNLIEQAELYRSKENPQFLEKVEIRDEEGNLKTRIIYEREPTECKFNGKLKKGWKETEKGFDGKGELQWIKEKVFVVEKTIDPFKEISVIERDAKGRIVEGRENKYNEEGLLKSSRFIGKDGKLKKEYIYEYLPNGARRILVRDLKGKTIKIDY